MEPPPPPFPPPPPPPTPTVFSCASLSSRLLQLQRRVSWASAYLHDSFWVKPVQDPIVVAGVALPTPAEGMARPLAQAYSNTDLVVIMSAQPELGQDLYSAVAWCTQRDQVRVLGCRGGVGV
jgi:hypothetical protein